VNETRVKPKAATWEPAAAFACFAGSILSLAIGFALTTNWLLNAVHHPYLHAVGIALLIIGIPILILGGHCLDLMDKKNKKSDQVLHLSRGSLRQ
jgi:predicted Na+-dependent transporter